MMQNRLKDNNRGGYVDDRYRSHDNFTNAFNMLAQIGLAEKGLTNQKYEAVNQASNAYTSRKEQEFKRDSWIAEKKLELSNYQAGQYNLIREKAEATVASRLADFEESEQIAFKKIVADIEKQYKSNPKEVQEKTDQVRKEYDARHARHKMKVIEDVNQEFESILIDMGKYAAANAGVFDIFDEKFNIPMFSNTKKLIQIPQNMENLVNKYFPSINNEGVK